MGACLLNTVGLIANVSAGSIQLSEYSEYHMGTMYGISSTINICESNQGQAIIALNASTQESDTYEKALSKCLGTTNVILAAVSFTPLRADRPSWSPTSRPMQTARPLWDPTPKPTATPRPTLFSEHGKNYCDTVIFRSTNAMHFESLSL